MYKDSQTQIVKAGKFEKPRSLYFTAIYENVVEFVCNNGITLNVYRFVSFVCGMTMTVVFKYKNIILQAVGNLVIYLK